MFNTKPQSWIDLEPDSPSKFNFYILLTGIILSLFMAFITAYQPLVLQRIRAAVYDFQVSRIDPGSPSQIPLIVDIDEQSLADYGQWPWPRYRIALLLEKLQEWGAEVVALDMVFAESDRTSPENLRNSIERDLSVTLSLDNIPESLRDNDKILAGVLQKGRFVLGNFFQFRNSRGKEYCTPKGTNIILFNEVNPSESGENLFKATSSVCNIPLLANAASGSGFYNAKLDVDGVLRSVPLLISYNSKIYPSLALEALAIAKDIEQLIVQQNGDGYRVRLGEKRISLDHTGSLHLRFRGPGHTFPYISAGSILDGTVSGDLFAGKIVFIGSSAAGINDIRSTPSDILMPGVEMHAVAVDNILQGDYFSRPLWFLSLEVILVIVTGIIFSLAMIRSGPYLGAGLTFAGATLIVTGSQMLLAKSGLILSPVAPIVTIFLCLTIISTLKYWREQFLHKDRIYQYQVTQEATIEGFGALAEYRDPETGGHIKRTQNYIKLLAGQLAQKKKYASTLNEAVIDALFKAAPLHDIGKVGVADTILLKSGRLSEDEFKEMELHTIYGAEVFKAIEKKVGHTPFLRIAREIANFHQEKWDGSGYPEGLVGVQIPLSARLMALADVYDALISARVYKPAYSHSVAKKYILNNRGTHFDPDVVDAFLQVEDDFIEIALKHADSPNQRQILLADRAG